MTFRSTHRLYPLSALALPFLVLLLSLLPGASVAQENRLALVIGNSEYADSPLSNPINDARDMASVLENLGFTVILRTDADRREMGRSIREFGSILKEQRGVGLFYYAGHGMQIDNRNFLIPVDTPLEEEDEVPYESIDVGSVLAKMESAGNSLNLIILDACRNNPFPARFRSASRGLARVQAPIGSLVVYATAPGAVAADGDGRNGVFTGALLKQLRTSGLSLTQTIRRTRAAVVEATNGLQVPWESSSLLKDYYFGASTQRTTRSANEPDSAISPAPTQLPTDLPDPQTDVSVAVESQPRLILEKPETINTREPDALPLPEAPVDRPSTAEQTETTNDTLALLDNPVPPVKPTPPVTAPAESENTAIIETAPVEVSPEASGTSRSATLSVQVDPPDARIRIMNIVEKYKPGILLDSDLEYDLYITRKGYNSYRETISLEEQATSLNIALKIRSVTEPDMVAIAGGAYNLGCMSEDQLCEAYEKPAQSVTIDPYFISVTEVTVAQFNEFVTSTGYVTDAEKNAGGNKGCFIWSDNGGISRSAARWEWDSKKNWRNPGYRQSARHPVTCVSWNDANGYARWMAQRTGRAYNLPSEAQWELAARANSNGAYGEAASSRKLCAIANVADKSESPSGSKWASRIDCTDHHWFSAPVASFRDNGFGVHDMQGNAWEWVADMWSDTLAGKPGNGTPYTRGAGDTRVLRGGGWDSDAKRVRISSRSKAGANGRASMTGFRLALQRD